RRTRALPPRPVLVLRPEDAAVDPDLDPGGNRLRARDARQPAARRPRLRDPAATLAHVGRSQHHGAELWRTAALAAARFRAAAAAAGPLPAARRAAARGRGTPRRRRDLRPDRG